MDTHELKQFESVYKPSKEVAFCWLRKQYVQLSTEENHTEIVDHANDSLRIWKAAKAQAVPEGFVLVSKDTLNKALNPNDYDEAVCSANELLAVIEVQQPSSTSGCPDEP